MAVLPGVLGCALLLRASGKQGESEVIARGTQSREPWDVEQQMPIRQDFRMVTPFDYNNRL
jgi:hypothetical protein